MSERLADVGGGVTLAYEQYGTGGIPLVLVAGLGQQFHDWPDGLCELLVARGYHVIRFDNRDAGRSTHGDFPPPGPVDLLARRWHRDQYTLADLAADTVGLLDALELPRAHLVGMSMGGMIAQTVAARHHARVGSLTSIMSTTGAARVGRPAWSTWRLMLGRPASTRDEHIDRAVRMYRHIRSAAYPFDESAVRATAARTWDRDPAPAAGVGRQLAGILKSGDRTGELRAVTAPTLVVHGDRDLMVAPTGATATARAISGARLRTLAGMGHDLPAAVWPTLADLIHEHIRTSETRSIDAPHP